MKHKGLTFRVMLALVLVLLLALPATVGAQGFAACSALDWTYTVDADFAQGTLVNVNYVDVADQLQLDSVATPFGFIWVAASGRDTIIKIDTVTGAILGEYWSAPYGRGGNPSRTTVDNNGNVWAGTRNEPPGGKGSVVHIGLVENGQCVDRNGDGVIQTSTGFGPLGWPNPGGVDDNGGVSSAVDECIIHYVRTSGTNVRTVAVDANNDLWVGGYGNRVHELYDGTTGAPIAGTQFTPGCGGYGGLIDGNGVLWSARGGAGNYLLRYDPSTKTGTCIYSPNNYGLGVDGFGNIWNSRWTSNRVRKLNSAGGFIGDYVTGGSASRGVAVTADNNIWVANSNSNNVGRLNNGGGLVTTVGVGSTPTGVAVDAAGKVWVTNYNSHSAMRINPATNLVDKTVSLGSGAFPYNYSDMTGSTLIAPPNTGTWTVVHDSLIIGAKWRGIGWSYQETGDGSITVKVASSADGVTFGPEYPVTSSSDPYLDDGVAGQYLKVIVSFSRASTGETPILYDLTIRANQAPIADPNGPYLGAAGSPIAFDGTGSSDPDCDTLTYAWEFGDVTPAGAGATPSHTYTAAGIYDVCLTVHDVYMDSDVACTIAIVYDPDAGFVTGGGWIDSPAGAYKADTSLTGNANFGFFAKYKKGKSTPDGQTEFQFHTGDLNFHSSSYDWLVVTGSNNAMFKGVGTINGLGEYKFRIWAGDDEPDTFRIRIWTEVGIVETDIYDNGSDQAIGGGNIVIHTKK